MNRPRSKAGLSAALVLAVLVVSTAGPLAAQRGRLVLPRNLRELVVQAETIVEGYVTSWRVEPHPEWQNIPTLVVTLRVQDVLKGEAGSVFTFRLHIVDIRDRWDGAGYKKGQHVLLLVNKKGKYDLTSTSGVEQGRFRILRDSQGLSYAVNGFGNARLFAGMEEQMKAQGVALQPQFMKLVAEHRAGPIPVDQLRSLIRSLAGGN